MRSIGATVVAAVALASASAASVSFGIYDAQESPGGGWQIASAADITANKAAFVESYNANKGLDTLIVVAAFCCSSGARPLPYAHVLEFDRIGLAVIFR